jgi:hypothetical protein
VISFFSCGSVAARGISHLQPHSYEEEVWGGCAKRTIFYRFSVADIVVIKSAPFCWVPVAHAYKPSYFGGRDQEDHGSMPAQANSSRESTLKKPFTNKGWWSGSRSRPLVQTPVSPSTQFLVLPKSIFLEMKGTQAFQ